MNSDDEMHPPNWQRYYSNTMLLPESDKLAGFLGAIPPGGRVLDFGAGTGRWAAAMLRDRPDIIIDLLDQNIHAATLLPDTWCGEKIAVNFQDFVPTHRYDGIWSFASLFFLEAKLFAPCFRTLVSALLPNGRLFFTMIEAGDAATSMRLHGMTKPEIEALLAQEALELVALKHTSASTYGAKKTTIPTYFVTARKPK